MMMAAACLAVMAAAAQKQLTILHTNDTHSTVMPLSENLNDTMKAGRGGFLRRVAMVESERKADPDLLLFDSGDFSQGSTYYTMYKGDVEVGLMNMMKYDAATIGNHEFDFGLENMVRIFRMAEFPVVCANYDFRGTIAEDVVKPYVVLRRSGLRIGVFGLSPKLGGLVSWKNYPGVKYLDPVKAAAETVAILKGKERCDVVVCLSHLGWDMKPEVDDSTVIANTEGIDIVLGGHTPTNLKYREWVTDKGGRRLPGDQNRKHRILIGKMTLKVDKVK